MFLDVSEIIAINIKRIGWFITTLESIQNREETCVLVILRNSMEQMGFLKKSRQAHITGASLWWGEESSSCAVDRAKLIIILTTSA